MTDELGKTVRTVVFGTDGEAQIEGLEAGVYFLHARKIVVVE